ncbi:MAG: hypothetical protein AB2813_03615 [Candidatus Sedimenticola endophacoides]
MSTIDSIGGVFLPALRPEGLAPVAPAHPGEPAQRQSSRQALPGSPRGPGFPANLQSRLDLLYQRGQFEAAAGDGRGRAAVHAYRRVGEVEERELVARMLGVG